MLTKFADAYMRHYGELSNSFQHTNVTLICESNAFPDQFINEKWINNLHINNKYKINFANKFGTPRQQAYRAKAIRARLQKSMHLAIVGNLNERILRASRPAGGSSAAGVPPNKTSTIYTKIYMWNLKLYGTSSEYCLDSFHIQLHWICHIYLKSGSINQSKVCWQGPVMYPGGY